MKVQPIRNPDPLGYMKAVLETLIVHIHGEYSDARIHPEHLIDLEHVFYEYLYDTQEYLWDSSPQDRTRVLQCIKSAHMEIFGPRIDRQELCTRVRDTLKRIARYEHLDDTMRSKNVIRFFEDLAHRIEALDSLPKTENAA